MSGMQMFAMDGCSTYSETELVQYSGLRNHITTRNVHVALSVFAIFCHNGFFWKFDHDPVVERATVLHVTGPLLLRNYNAGCDR